MKSLKCVKCSNESIEIIKDFFHASGGGNISKGRTFGLEKNFALVTFYICKDCGYIEQYLEVKELEKIIK